MNWDAVRYGFLDELEKIAAVSMKGLSTETIMSAQDPEPMQTQGYQKARDILNRAEMMKTKTSARHVRGSGSAVGLPQVQRLQEADKKDPSLAGTATSLAGHTVAGAGAGRMVGFMAHGPKAGLSNAAKQSLHGKQWYGTAIGAGLGAAAYGARKMRERQQMNKTSSVTPASQLRSARNTARTPGHGIKSGPSLRSQVPGTMGNTGRTL